MVVLSLLLPCAIVRIYPPGQPELISLGKGVQDFPELRWSHGKLDPVFPGYGSHHLV